MINENVSTSVYNDDDDNNNREDNDTAITNKLITITIHINQLITNITNNYRNTYNVILCGIQTSVYNDDDDNHNRDDKTYL